MLRLKHFTNFKKKDVLQYFRKLFQTTKSKISHRRRLQVHSKIPHFETHQGSVFGGGEVDFAQASQQLRVSESGKRIYLAEVPR